MEFRNISNTLQIAQSRTNNVQSEIRPLWIDAYGQNFVELVLGDLQDDVKDITGTTDEAAIQQNKNKQNRQFNQQYIATAVGRDAAQQSSNQQLDGKITDLQQKAESTIPQAEALENARGELSSELTELDARVTAASNKSQYITF